jgi:predicted transposase YbfD/YdcC
MKKRGDPCGCIAKFLNQYPREHMKELNGLKYEDDVCFVECDGHVIRAYSYEIVSSTRYRNGECIMTIW